MGLTPAPTSPSHQPPIPRSRVVGGLLLAVMACAGPGIPDWTDAQGYRWRPLEYRGRGSDGFTQLTASQTGIGAANGFSQDQLVENQHVLNGSGVAMGDVDGDGWVDVYLSRLGFPGVLYRNLGGWKFEDVTATAGVANPDRLATGAVFADVDGDGDPDLLVSALGGPNALFINAGDGTFADSTHSAGLDSDRGSHTMTLADVDGDGDLDLYVANYKFKTVKDLFPPDVRAFDRVVRQEGNNYSVAPEFADHYRLVRQETRIARQELAEPDAFYLNDGSGHFQAVDFTAGRFRDEDGQVLAETPRDWGLSARFYDADLDGDPDLYVTNDFESVDRFWLNDGSGHFQAVPRLALRMFSQSSMAVDFSDIDRDGDVDFFTADMLSRDPRSRRTQVALTPAEEPRLGVFDDRPQRQRNALFVNRGDGTYAEVAPQSGLAASGWSWGSSFLDVDLDGFEDLLVANGYGNDALDGGTQRRLAMQPAGRDWRRDILEFPPLSLPNAAFRNTGDGRFEDVSDTWGFGVDRDISHGLAMADLDRDGDLDIVVNRQDLPPAVYRNDAAGSRVAIRLVGTAPNTAAVGSRIEVHGHIAGVQTKEVTSGGLYLSHSDHTYTFATDADASLRIEIHWRSGRRTTIADVSPDRIYEITEPDTPPFPAPSPAAIETIFTDASAQLPHRHTETPFDDFRRQPLLPNRLSQLGPGLTWYDMDRDGDDDLLVGSGANGQLSYLRNDQGDFTSVPVALDPIPFDQTTILPFRVGSELSLLVGQTNYEANNPAEAEQLPGVIRVVATGFDGPRVQPRAVPIAPGVRTSVGPLSLGDYDGDGDLDLFVGGRVLPAAYPLSPESRLYRNEGNGRFVEDATAGRILRTVGLVSASMFSDMDGDGDPDLILATEWGPVRVIENRNGRLTDVTRSKGLADYTGRWNGIATGDFDADGRMDLVATNWGRNTLLNPTANRPLRAIFADFDNNGSLDFLPGQFAEDLGDFAVVTDLTSLMRAMPFLQRRIPSFNAFADATLENLIGPAIRNANQLELRTFDHMVFMNRGERYEAVPLPPEAQSAPAFYAGVADFDGDGHDDVFLSQNFYPTRPEAERYDAGRGIWLRGDGNGSLTAESGTRTGVKVYGDQRGAALADYDRDGRVDLAVSQNGAATVLYHNRGAAPGIRVVLQGPVVNPDAIGAAVRLVYPDGHGPKREIHAGSGYWSSNAPTLPLGLRGPANAVYVRWPDGSETTTPIPPDMAGEEITIDTNGSIITGRSR